MMTLAIIDKEKGTEEYHELGNGFKIIPTGTEGLEQAVERFPKATSFITSDKVTVPVLQENRYVITGSEGQTVKVIE